jgi:hypothetical protein
MSFNGNLQPASDEGTDLTTKGDIHTFSTENTRLPVGADTRILQANSATSTGLEWIVAGGGGIEESFTVTTKTTTTPTSQTGFKGIIVDCTKVTAGNVQVNVDGSAYGDPVDSGTAQAFAVNPSSALNFVSTGAGRQLTGASFVQNSNEGSTVASPICLWSDPTGTMWLHCQGLGGGDVYGCQETSAQWDVSNFTAPLDTYSGDPYGATRSTGCASRYTGTYTVPDIPAYSGATSGGNYMNNNSIGGTYGDGITVSSLAPNYWKAGGSIGSSGEINMNGVDNDCYGMATNDNQSIWFIAGRQNDSIYKLQTIAGMTNGYALYIDNGSTGVVYQTLVISAQLTDVVDISFTNDGLWLVVAGASGNVYSYNLTSAWDLTTATYDQTFSTSAQSTSIGGIQVKGDGSAVYVLDSQPTGTNYIMEYDVSGAFTGTARIIMIGT